MNDNRKNVLVTGCSSGIGYAIATELPPDLFRVFASARQKSDLSRLEQMGLDTFELDLNHPSSINNAMSALLEKTDGKLFGVVNNAAFGQPGAVEDLSRDAMREQFETNVFGTQELTNLCLPVFRRQNKGRIIQISSILGRICLANRGAYNASKYALEALSDSMRLELNGTDIHVSLIEPGAIESRFRQNALNAFQRHIDSENSIHARLYQAVVERLSSDSTAAFTLPASAITRPVLHALTSRRPKIRYPVTLPARVLPNLKRFLTDRSMDWILHRSGDKVPRE